MLMAKLIYPCLEFASSYIEGLREFADRYPAEWLRETERDFGSHLKKLESRKLGDARTEGIPQHMLWLVDNERYLGHVNVRTRLNEKLSRLGGHIGYEIRPHTLDSRSSAFGAYGRHYGQIPSIAEILS